MGQKVTFSDTVRKSFWFPPSVDPDFIMEKVSLRGPCILNTPLTFVNFPVEQKRRGLGLRAGQIPENVIALFYYHYAMGRLVFLQRGFKS